MGKKTVLHIAGTGKLLFSIGAGSIGGGKADLILPSIIFEFALTALLFFIFVGKTDKNEGITEFIPEQGP